MVFALRSPSAERSEDKPLPLSQELSQAISQMNNLFSPMESHWACQLFLRTGSMPSGRCSTQNGINGILKVLGLLRVCQAIFTIQILCTGIVVAVFFFLSSWDFCMNMYVSASMCSSCFIFGSFSYLFVLFYFNLFVLFYCYSLHTCLFSNDRQGVNLNETEDLEELKEEKA